MWKVYVFTMPIKEALRQAIGTFLFPMSPAVVIGRVIQEVESKTNPENT